VLAAKKHKKHKEKQLLLFLLHFLRFFAANHPCFVFKATLNRIPLSVIAVMTKLKLIPGDRTMCPCQFKLSCLFDSRRFSFKLRGKPDLNPGQSH